MATIGTIAIGVRAQTAGFNRDIGQVEDRLRNFKSNSQGIVGSVVAGFGQLGLAIQGVKAVAGGLIEAISGPIALAAEAEKTAVSFKVLLGSASLAEKTLMELKQFAASTPFEFPELSQAATKMLSFGFSAEETIPELRRLGDVSSALGIPLGEMAELWGKNKVQGRIFAQDINQLLGRGVPIISELAKVFGVAENKIKDMVSAGQVNFSHLEQALQNMTNEGGKFSGMMAEQSQTLGGLWSTLRDNIGLALTDIGFAIVDTFNLKGVAANVISFLTNMKPQFMSFLEGVKSGVNQIKPIIVELWNVVKARFKMMYEIISTVLGQVSGLFSGIALPSFTQFRDWILDALIAVEFGFNNWRDVLKLSVSSSLLSIVRFAGQVKHFFVTAIPVYLKFLFDNWKEILHDIGEFQLKAFENITSNIVAIFKNLPGLISGTVSFSELWTPLLDGAEFQLKKLPEVPERVMGDLETSLQQDVDNITNNMASSFAEFRDKQRKSLLPPPEVKQAIDDVTTSAQQASQAIEETIPQELKDKAKDVFDGTRNELEKFKQEAGELKYLLQKGLIDQDTFNRAVENALPNKISQIIEDSKTPLEKFREELSQLQEFRQLNLINDEQFDKAKAKLAKDVNVTQEVKFAGEAKAQSKEAAAAIIRHQFGKVPDLKMDLAKQELAESTKQTNWLEKIAGRIPAIAPKLDKGELPQQPAINVAAAAVPHVNVPQFALPEPAAVNVPSFPQPNIGLPEFNLPQPNINLPQLGLPEPANISLPRPEAPQLPRIDVPKFGIPEPQRINVPSLPRPEAPQLPKIDVPKIDVPKLDIPKIALPNINVPQTPQPRFPQLAQPDINISKESPQQVQFTQQQQNTKLMESLLAALVKLLTEEVKETKQQTSYQRQLVNKEQDVFSL